MSSRSSETNETKLAMLEHGGRRGEISIMFTGFAHQDHSQGSHQCLAAGHYLHHCSVPLGRERVRKPWVGAEGEGVQEGGLSPPLLLPKGIFYSLLDSPKVTWLQHCAPPFLLELRSLGT